MFILYILGGIILLVLLVAALAGTKWSYHKTILIQAPAAAVWPHVCSLSAINTWNPWLSLDPDIKQQITGTDGKPGAVYSWDSQVKAAGAGNQTITGIIENKEFATHIEFIRPFKGKGEGYLRLQEVPGGTEATWGIDSSTPYPMNFIKIFGVIEKNLERDFTKGLNKLKTICEQK